MLSDISLDFKQGERHCIMGASGTGKTTLLNIIMGLEKPDSGVVSGLSGLTLSPVFQEDRLCENLSVASNLRLVCKGRRDESRMEELLKGLLLPDCLKQPVNTLSGGMKRRVAIARALFHDGDVLLFDEPYKGLDLETKSIVADYVEKSRHGRTMIWVSHDLEEARQNSDNIIELSD